MRTKNVHSEIVYALAATQNVPPDHLHVKVANTFRLEKLLKVLV